MVRVNPVAGTTNTNTNMAKKVTKHQNVSPELTPHDPINDTGKALRGYRVAIETKTSFYDLYVEKVGNVFHLPHNQSLLNTVADKSNLPTRESISMSFVINMLPAKKEGQTISNYLIEMTLLILEKIGITRIRKIEPKLTTS